MITMSYNYIFPDDLTILYRGGCECPRCGSTRFDLAVTVHTKANMVEHEAGGLLLIDDDEHSGLYHARCRDCDVEIDPYSIGIYPCPPEEFNA